MGVLRFIGCMALVYVVVLMLKIIAIGTVVYVSIKAGYSVNIEKETIQESDEQDTIY